MLPPLDEMHPKVRALLIYWRSLVSAERLPGRRDIDPLAIPLLLSNIWMVDVLRAPYRFRVRLVGEEARVAGALLRKGVFLDELHDGTLPQRFMEGLRRVIEEHEPDWYRGRPLA